MYHKLTRDHFLGFRLTEVIEKGNYVWSTMWIIII